MNSVEFTLKKRWISDNSTREYSPIPTAGEFSRRSQNDVDISDFENMDTASSDDETLIIDPDILDVLADLPPKNQWTEHLVEYPVIYVANVNRLLNSTVIWRLFNDNEIFLFWTFVSCQFQ